jgi:hypothetical protein
VNPLAAVPVSRDPLVPRRVVGLVIGVFAIALGIAGCSRPAPVPEAAVPVPVAGVPTAVDRFVERAGELGVVFTHRNGGEADHSTILESLGGGVGWFDFDRDGWIDLMATGGGGFAAGPAITGHPAGLFRSRGGRAFTAVAGPAGLTAADLYSHGVAVGDYDNDGFQDLVVTGYGPAQLWHNRGDGTFARLPAPWGDDDRWTSSAGWGDLDGDGALDLYLARYVNWSFANHPVCGFDRRQREICPPRMFTGLPDALYRSDGAGGLYDASADAGLRTDGKGLGVLLADLDVDGDVDIYVANDTTDNFLYVNDGHGRLEERALLAGVAYDDQGLPNGSMGVDCCDFNGDGRPDLWVANYERESFALYRNEGRGQFLHVSRRHGITDLGGLFVGFGTACDDFDRDGRTDIAVANGHVIKYPDASPRKQQPLLLRFDGDRFRRAAAAPGTYFAAVHEGRGLAVGDFDGDGDGDLAISHLNEPLAVLENRFPAGGRSVAVELVGTVSNRDAVGARVTLESGTGSVVGQVVGGGSYLSHSDRRLRLTCPAGAGPLRLKIDWPAGGRQELAIDATTDLVRVVEQPTDGTRVARNDPPGSVPP